MLVKHKPATKSIKKTSLGALPAGDVCWTNYKLEHIPFACFERISQKFVVQFILAQKAINNFTHFFRASVSDVAQSMQRTFTTSFMFDGKSFFKDV